MKAGIPAADIAAAMYAFSGVLAALLRRGTTGRGGPVEISMLESLAEWMGHPLHHAMHGGDAPGAHRARARRDRARTTPIRRRTAGRCCCRCRTTGSGGGWPNRCWGGPSWRDDPAFATNAARIGEPGEDRCGWWREALGALSADEALGAAGGGGHRVRAAATT